MADKTIHPFEGIGDATPIGIAGISTNEDGTMEITLSNGDNYSINLNHTHEGMAKLVKDTAANLPDVEDMEEGTIYAEVDDGEVNVLYIGDTPFYGGGGASSGPVLRIPADESTIDVGTIETGESSVEKVVTVKGKNLTQALTVAVTGTGYSIKNGVSSISATDANVGTSITIVCTNAAENAAGTLSIYSSEVSCDCDLVANVPVYVELAGVKFTGSQWLQTDYVPNPNTEFDLDCKLEVNANTDVRKSFADGYCAYLLHCASYNGNVFFFSTSGEEQNTSSYNILTKNNVSADNLGTQRLVFEQNTAAMLQRGTLKYEKYNGAMRLSFNNKSVGLGLKSGSQNSGLAICRHLTQNVTMNRWNLYIYEFTINENGTVVKHFVPRTKNGIVGLLDTVSGTFISSETSTELEAVTQSNS